MCPQLTLLGRCFSLGQHFSLGQRFSLDQQFSLDQRLGLGHRFSLNQPGCSDERERGGERERSRNGTVSQACTSICPRVFVLASRRCDNCVHRITCSEPRFTPEFFGVGVCSVLHHGFMYLSIYYTRVFVPDSRRCDIICASRDHLFITSSQSGAFWCWCALSTVLSNSHVPANR